MLIYLPPGQCLKENIFSIDVFPNHNETTSCKKQKRMVFFLYPEAWNRECGWPMQEKNNINNIILNVFDSFSVCDNIKVNDILNEEWKTNDYNWSDTYWCHWPPWLYLPSTVLSTTYTVDLYIGKHVEKKNMKNLSCKPP